MIVVELGVEKSVRIRGPYARTASVRNDVSDVLFRRRITHPQGEEFGALVVKSPEQALMVRRMVDAGNAEIGLALRLGIAIQKHIFRAAVAGNTEVAGLFATGLIRGSIGKRPVVHRHRGIVFLDAALHLGEQRLPQCVGVGHQGCLIGVFSLKVRANLRIEGGRISKDLLPIVRAQPREFVASCMPVAGFRPIFAASGGGIDRRKSTVLGHGSQFWERLNDR